MNLINWLKAKYKKWKSKRVMKKMLKLTRHVYCWKVGILGQVYDYTGVKQ